MQKQSKLKVEVWPKISPECKYVVWIVATSKTGTTNPMPKRNAMEMIRERRANGEYAELIKAWSCVQSKNLLPVTEGAL